MDDRTLKELIYLARSNDPVALQYLYSYYDALVKAVMKDEVYLIYVSRSTGLIAGRIDYLR